MVADGGPSPGHVDPVVLVVVDDHEDADRYAEWLEKQWSVVTVADASEAVDALDAAPVVALIDRRLTDVDLLLDRFEQRAANDRVAVLAADEPEADRQVFDDVLVEPVSRETVFETVEALSLWVRYDELLDEYFALAAERARASGPETDSYGELGVRLSDVRASVDEVLAELAAHGTDVDLYAALADGPEDDEGPTGP